jgi:hypothetical protein
MRSHIYTPGGYVSVLASQCGTSSPKGLLMPQISRSWYAVFPTGSSDDDLVEPLPT